VRSGAIDPGARGALPPAKAPVATFEDYCREKWGWEKRYWQYVIAGAEAVQSLPEASRTIVHTETQAREVAKVPEEKRAEDV
jgi:hypothetical protein